jgi:hypothetical protein
MYMVDSIDDGKAVAEIVRASEGREMTADDIAAMRLRRLQSLPTSLPVGGIITPV